jgi:hypothetical protein
MRLAWVGVWCYLARFADGQFGRSGQREGRIPLWGGSED